MTHIRAGSGLPWEEVPAKARRVPVTKGEMATFFAWEKLRLVYNTILAGVVVWFAVSHGLIGDYWFWLQVVGGAVIANVCFCAGPVIENYLRLLYGADGSLVRIILFCLGTILAWVMAKAYLYQLLQPHMWGWS